MGFKKAKKEKKGMSLILTLLIISSVLTGTILVAEITIRHAQIIHGAEISEKAYFAAETGIQKMAYQIEKNYKDISTYSLPEDVLSDGKSTYSATISTDTYCPDASETECKYYPSDPECPGELDRCPISNTNAWTISLSPGESFQLNLDINGAIYPNSIDITRSGLEDTDIIVYKCTTGGDPRECGETMSQTFSITFPYPFNISDYEGKYYKLRINNVGSGSENYTLTPSAEAALPLPIGIEISATGGYTGYQRKLKTNLPKWQKFGI